MKLYLKAERCFSPKCPIDREALPPGMHGARRGKTSEYGVRLREKQKLKRFYGVLEAQFRRYYTLATRAVGNTGEQLLSILERRLDNVVHRLGFAINRNSARQMVAHGHILVNGVKCDIPSMLVKPGDVISVQTPGGGGCEAVWERPVEQVAADVALGKISVERARAAYGVVVDPSTFAVDATATAEARARLAQSSPGKAGV